MPVTRVGINGFGRIGRCAFRQLFEREDIEVALINDLVDGEDLAYLLKYDSVHGRLEQPIRFEDGHLTIEDDRVAVTSVKDPAEIPWGDHGVDIVIESTGVFRARDKAAGHLDPVKAVVISAPSDDADAHVVYGVNHESIDAKQHRVISATSCTTNCLVPMVHVLDQAFGVESGTFTTVHAYTASQKLVDTAARKRRRGRAGALNLIPTSTGAAEASGRVLEHLGGKLHGIAVRVPVPSGSLTDLVVRCRDRVDASKVADAYEKAANGPLEGVLRLADDDLVSLDIVGDEHSVIVDRPMISVTDDHTVKVIGWYDNEWGYAARLVDLVEYVGDL